jgi:hypothetical protein
MMKPSLTPVAYSPRQLLIYWVIWIVGNAASIYLRLYLRTDLILVIWFISVFIVQGYLFTQLYQKHHGTRIQLLWQLLLLTGFIMSAIEVIFATWFTEDCIYTGNHCYGLNLSYLRGSWWQ